MCLTSHLVLKPPNIWHHTLHIFLIVKIQKKNDATIIWGNHNSKWTFQHPAHMQLKEFTWLSAIPTPLKSVDITKISSELNKITLSEIYKRLSAQECFYWIICLKIIQLALHM